MIRSWRRPCRAAHLVADGMSVVWALRLSGQPIPERVAGVDLMARLLVMAGAHRLRVYFLGARREVVTALVETSRIQYPGIEIAGFRDGYFGPEDHEAVVEEIRASRRHAVRRPAHPLQGDLVRAPPPAPRGARNHGRRRRFRRAGRLHQARSSLGAGAGAGVVLAAPAGSAPQTVERYLNHQQRVHLARRAGDRCSPPGTTAARHRGANVTSGLLCTMHTALCKRQPSVLTDQIMSAHSEYSEFTANLALGLNNPNLRRAQPHPVDMLRRAPLATGSGPPSETGSTTFIKSKSQFRTNIPASADD
jgi:Glycosyl transferase WecG/TagA/CpsF family